MAAGCHAGVFAGTRVAHPLNAPLLTRSPTLARMRSAGLKHHPRFHWCTPHIHRCQSNTANCRTPGWARRGTLRQPSAPTTGDHWRLTACARRVCTSPDASHLILPLTPAVTTNESNTASCPFCAVGVPLHPSSACMVWGEVGAAQSGMKLPAKHCWLGASELSPGARHAEQSMLRTVTPVAACELHCAASGAKLLTLLAPFLVLFVTAAVATRLRVLRAAGAARDAVRGCSGVHAGGRARAAAAASIAVMRLCAARPCQ